VGHEVRAEDKFKDSSDHITTMAQVSVLFYKLHSLKIVQNLKFGFENDGNQSELYLERKKRFECGSRLVCGGFED